MSPLKQKLDVAKAAYDAACITLDEARRAYEDGAGKRYTEIKKSLAVLKNTIAGHERAHQAAKDMLSQALRDSNGAITAPAKEALAARRNAEDMLEECRGLLDQVEREALAVRLEASYAANAYRLAYQTATECWGKMNVYAVLCECGERLAAAMCVVPFGSMAEHGRVEDQLTAPRHILMSEINLMLEEYKGDTKPYKDELGIFDLGGMSSDEIMSPAEMVMARTRTSAR